MPHPGTQVMIWTLICLALVLIWTVTILLVHALIGGQRGYQTVDAESARVGDAPDDDESSIARLVSTYTSCEQDSYRARGRWATNDI